MRYSKANTASSFAHIDSAVSTMLNAMGSNTPLNRYPVELTGKDKIVADLRDQYNDAMNTITAIIAVRQDRLTFRAKEDKYLDEYFKEAESNAEAYHQAFKALGGTENNAWEAHEKMADARYDDPDILNVDCINDDPEEIMNRVKNFAMTMAMLKNKTVFLKNYPGRAKHEIKVLKEICPSLTFVQDASDSD